MSLIKVICRDQVAHGRLFRWSTRKSATVAAELDALFQQITAGTDYTTLTQFSTDAPGANDLVVYFLGPREASIIQRVTGIQAGTNAGATAHTDRGMISEVYIHNISVAPRAIAKLAFHELMHNKLDAASDASQRIVQDIHAHGGGGLATGGPIGENTLLTPENIELMRRALGTSIPQYSG